jgi:hypothetical protein
LGEELLRLKETTSILRSQGSKENTIAFLMAISQLLPPSDDLALSLGKKGTHEYVVDRRGVAVITTSQDEYLPFFSAMEKRINYESIPPDILIKVAREPKELLVQLAKILKDFSKTHPKYSNLASEVEVLAKG